MPATDNKPSEPALLLNVAAVAQLLDISPRQVLRMVEAGQFPRPLSVGLKLKRWPRSTVEKWIEVQKEANRG